MKINQKTIRNFTVLSCIILVLFLAGCFLKPAVTPPLPEQPTFTHYRVVTQAYKDSNPAHSIEIAWRANSIEYSFKIFKSLNGNSFEELFDDGMNQSSYYQRKSCSCSFTDIEVQPSNQYSYYVLAYNEKGEIGQTETFTRNIFLPPCTLKEPQDNAEVDTPIPTFSWDNKELTKYLTKSKAEGYLKTHLKVNNETIQQEVWNMTFEDSTVDNVTYNLDSTGEPLVNDNEYEWFHWTDAYDAEGNLIANAYSNSWHFHYKGPIKAVLMGKIMVPETPKFISKDVTGTIPLVGATVTITDSEGNTHTGTTQAQGQYIFPQVAPGTNYIITAVGEVDGQTVVYKDVVPSIALHEVFDAGVADAESTALALVMEAMLADDPNLAPEEINLDDILNASSFTDLVTTVGEVLIAYGDVTEDSGVADAVETVEEELLFFADFEARSHIHRGLNGELGHYVHLLWKPYPDANSYQIYKKVGSSGYTTVNLEINYDEGMKRYGAWDDDISPETVYEYYIEAVTLIGTVSCPSEIVDTWLPDTAPEIPTMNAVVTNPNPTFQWESLGISTFPYHDRIYSGDVELHVTDETIGEDVWEIEINGLDISSVVYNDPRAEEPAVVLAEGHEYSWFVIFDGSDAPDLAGKEIANSSCRSIFYYGYKPWIVYYNAETTSPEEAVLGIRWNDCTNANDYKIYKTIDNTNFDELTDDYTFRDGWYRFHDFDVTLGNTYYYKVEAYNNTSLINTSEVMIVDTWLPGITALSPINNEVVIASNPTFSWHYELTLGFPYGTFDFIGGGLIVEDLTSDETVWDIDLDDLNTSSITYAGSPLTEGHRYYWERWISSRNEEGNICTTNTGGSFYYGSTIDGTSWVETNRDNPPQYYTRGGWIAYPGATSYDLYRREGTTDGFGIIDIELHFDEEDNEYNFWDDSVSSGIIYQYYMVAKDTSGPIYQSDILTINTWLSPISVVFPAHDSVLTETNLPLQLQWTSPAPFPTNIISGDINIGIYDETIGEDVWDYKTYDLGVTSVTIPIAEIDFQEGHKYYWEVMYDGEDNEDEIANTVCSSWFFYGSKPFKVRANTFAGMYEQCFVEIDWTSVGDNYNYVIYRSEDEGLSFGILSSVYETTDGYFPYYFVDNTVIVNNRYDYKIVASNIEGEEITSNIVTVDTWLPECESFTPVDGAVIPVDTVQVFSWTFPLDFDFPYNEKIYFDDSRFFIDDKVSGEEIYYIYEEGEWRDSITYDCSGLILGNEYSWYFEFWGNDSEWNTGAGFGLGGSFFYGSKPFEVNASSITGSSGDHQIEVRWPIYESASDYKVYRSTNGVSDGMIFDTYGKTPDFYDPTIDWWINQGVDYSFCTDGDSIGFVDFTVTDSNSYSYYVVAYGGNLTEEISSNETMSIHTWLPACWLVAPDNNSNITNTHPLLEWSPPGIEVSEEFPYGQITEDRMRLKVADLTANEEVWDIDFFDWTTCSIIYNGDPLIAGHSYIWRWYPIGFDQDGHFIGEAIGGTRVFTYYEEMPLEINISAGTNSDAPDGHNVGLGWNEYVGANDYEVWRSKNNGSFEKLTNYEERNGGYWYADWDIADGNTYNYYVVALDGTETIQTSPTLEVDTWLPAILPVGPLQGSLVIDPNPVFECYYEAPISFPYNSVFEYGGGGFDLNDVTTGDNIWEIEADEDVFSVTYDGPPLEDGHEYQWGRHLVGEDGNIGVFSVCNGGGFYYGYQPWEYHCTAHSGPGHIHAEFYWNELPEASSYKLLKSTDGVNFIDMNANYEWIENNNEYNFWDEAVTEESAPYYYKIEAYNASNVLIQTSDTMIVDAWLPAMIADTPINNEIVTGNAITFSWHDENTISFPYYNGEYEFHGAGFFLRNALTGDYIFEDHWDDYITKSIIYDNLPLVEGNRYEWDHYIYGENDNRTGIASTTSGGFYYQNVEIVSKYIARTYKDSATIDLKWIDTVEATDYKIFKSESDEIFEDITGDYRNCDGGDWVFQDDNDVIFGNNYKYYIEAFKDGVKIGSSPIMTVDTWFPRMISLQPYEEEIISDLYPVFCWDYESPILFPYNGYNLKDAKFGVADYTEWNELMYIDLYDPNTFSITYSGPEMIDGHRHTWFRYIEAEKDMGSYIASIYTHGGGDFTFDTN